MGDNMSTFFDPVVHLLDGIDLFESRGWEPGGMVERSVGSRDTEECCSVRSRAVLIA
ncbi:hypothetical protein [Nocardia sp. X0981]